MADPWLMTVGGWDVIKAIETNYKGYRFRSRLEARWAVYFDALDIRWQYEKEGYNLGGVYYLPDFWLPQVSMWAEVKPDGYSRSGLRPYTPQWEAWNKLLLLTDGTGFPSIMLDGQPELRSYDVYHGDQGDGEEHGPNFYDYVLTNRYVHDEGRFFSWGSGCEVGAGEFPDVAHGVEAARSARFGR